MLIKGVVFVLYYVEVGTLEKNTKNHNSYLFFCHKIKTKA